MLTDEALTRARSEGFQINVKTLQSRTGVVQRCNSRGTHEDPAPLAVHDESQHPGSITPPAGHDNDVVYFSYGTPTGIKHRQPHHAVGVDELLGGRHDVRLLGYHNINAPMSTYECRARRRVSSAVVARWSPHDEQLRSRTDHPDTEGSKKCHPRIERNIHYGVN
jgi:hypothetical protein